MSTRLSWDQPSKVDLLRQRNKKNGPPPSNDKNPLNSIPPQLAFDNMNGKNENKTKRKRYIAKIKNVCMAIPFDPNESLLSFQKEVVIRANTHRKLKNEAKLSNRIQFIKLATPHFPQLIDCYGHDSLCEIATESDILIFDTISDDEKNENEAQQLYVNTFKPSNINSIYVPQKHISNNKEKIKKKKKVNNNYVSHTPTPNTNNKHKKEEKIKRKSFIDKNIKKKDKENKNKNKNNNSRRNLSADLDGNIIMNTNKKNKKNVSKNTKRSNTTVINPMISSKSGGDLHRNNNRNNDGNESNDSEDSVRSGYSGHSGYGSDEKEKLDNLEIISANNNNNNNNNKKQKKNKKKKKKKKFK